MVLFVPGKGRSSQGVSLGKQVAVVVVGIGSAGGASEFVEWLVAVASTQVRRRPIADAIIRVILVWLGAVGRCGQTIDWIIAVGVIARSVRPVGNVICVVVLILVADERYRE